MNGISCQLGSYCDVNTLTCFCDDTTKIAVGGNCVDRLRSKPGMPCNNGEICINSGICNQNGICECLPNTSVLEGVFCVEHKPGKVFKKMMRLYSFEFYFKFL